jgi:hypothetical protein
VAERGVLRLTLRYADINSLFEMPNVSPYSEDFLEYGTVPGVEYIYNELQANPALKQVETTIVLPPEQITPDLERSTREASARPIPCKERATGHPLPEDGALGTLLTSDRPRDDYRRPHERRRSRRKCNSGGL